MKNEKEALNLIKSQIRFCTTSLIAFLYLGIAAIYLKQFSKDEGLHFAELFLCFTFFFIAVSVLRLRQTLVKPFKIFKRDDILIRESMSTYNAIQVFTIYCISILDNDNKDKAKLIKDRAVSEKLISRDDTNLTKVTFGGVRSGRRAIVIITYENFLFIYSKALDYAPQIIKASDILEFTIYESTTFKIRIKYRCKNKIKQIRLHSCEHDKWIEWLAMHKVTKTSA